MRIYIMTQDGRAAHVFLLNKTSHRVQLHSPFLLNDNSKEVSLSFSFATEQRSIEKRSHLIVLRALVNFCIFVFGHLSKHEALIDVFGLGNASTSPQSSNLNEGESTPRLPCVGSG